MLPEILWEIRWGPSKMSRIRSTALVSDITIGLNQFYRIPVLALGPGAVHTRCLRWCAVISVNGFKPFSYSWCDPNRFRAHILSYRSPRLHSDRLGNPYGFHGFLGLHYNNLTLSSFPKHFWDTGYRNDPWKHQAKPQVCVQMRLCHRSFTLFLDRWTPFPIKLSKVSLISSLLRTSNQEWFSKIRYEK